MHKYIMHATSNVISVNQTRLVRLSFNMKLGYAISILLSIVDCKDVIKLNQPHRSQFILHT